jgi:hypothetical protein
MTDGHTTKRALVLDKQICANNTCLIRTAFSFSRTFVRRHTTHVVVETDDALVAIRRSSRYLQGLARGCWVVSSAWLDACLEAGHLVKEQGYEVKGVRINKEISPRTLAAEKAARGGPERARRFKNLHPTPSGMFSGMTFFIRGTRGPHSMDKRLVSELVEVQGGATVEFLAGEDATEGAAGPWPTVLVGEEAVGKGIARRLPGSIVLDWAWVLDSTTAADLLPQAEYCFSV